MKPPSRQLYVENHRAHEVMLGCQQSVQGNSGIITCASIMVGHSGRPFWEMVGHLADMHEKRPMASSYFYSSGPIENCIVFALRGPGVQKYVMSLWASVGVSVETPSSFQP